MSFMFANSGDFRNPSHANLLDNALASVRRMCVEYAATQTVGLRADLAAACSERDQLISLLNLEKGAATLLLAERDRLASQLATLRTLLADTRPAIVARAATDPLGLDPSLLPRIDAALAP